MAEKNKKILKTISILISAIIVIYIALGFFFQDRYYFGTKVNNIRIGGKTVDEAKEKISEEISNYKLTLEGRENFKSEILGKNIGLIFNDTNELQTLKDSQEPFKWGLNIFKNKGDTKLDNYLIYNKEKLNNEIDKLSLFKKENIIKPENPKFIYKDGKYEVSKEIMGTKINKKLLKEKIVKAIETDKENLNLEEEKVYINPKYTLSSKKVDKTRKTLDKYLNSEITYDLGNGTEVVNSSLIHKWLYVNDDLNPKINVEKVSEFVNKIAQKQNTVGQGILFKTSDGREINVPGGNFGWLVNKSAEVDKLIEEIKSGKKVTREPIYLYKGIVKNSNEVGNTYVEIDLSKQHVWYYKDGNLITEGDIVTGNVAKNYTTPPGLFRLTYKESKATLRGANYETKVDYWMPFNGGIGLHDGWWRKKFGGEIYKTNGSHGCINLPPAVAGAIFNNISSGTPVVCYN